MCTARYGSAADPSGCCLLHSRSVRLCYNNRRFVSSWSREVSAFRRADRQAQHLAAADRDRDNHRNRHDAPLLQRRSGPVILQGAGEKRGDLVVDLGAHNHETWFSEMPIHRLRQTVDPSGVETPCTRPPGQPPPVPSRPIAEAPESPESSRPARVSHTRFAAAVAVRCARAAPVRLSTSNSISARGNSIISRSKSASELFSKQTAKAHLLLAGGEISNPRFAAGL